MDNRFSIAGLILLAALLLGGGLAGCGQKGDLYLPDPNRQAESKRS